MAKTPSTMTPLHTTAPDFDLPNMNPAWHGARATLSDFAGSPGLLVMFICNHCPYVKHIASTLAAVTLRAQAKGISVVAIQSNDVASYPDDAPSLIAAECLERGYTFPYLHDTTQEIAKAFHAACTPDFFLYDAQRKLVYRGQFDDARPGNGKPITGHDLERAIDALLHYTPIPEPQRPSLGCNIKWRPGNEPSYFG